ncbi:hypothetical protein E3N88_45863 [Mikania micrantha]|uniref:Uncharacterized protein n=1 Tax=Mikania micrantha TaxID=192012 RepID=A0A5N6L7V2_9ASTR|nr:hypothetical protein E3N88_45863 [Mikania micrantha]
MFYLSDLDYLTMTDAYEYVGLTVTNHGDLSGYGSLSHVNDSFASEIGSIYSKHHEQVNNVNLLSKGSILEAFESVTRKEDVDCELIGTKNFNLACDVDPMFDCLVKKLIFEQQRGCVERWRCATMAGKMRSKVSKEGSGGAFSRRSIDVHLLRMERETQLELLMRIERVERCN